MRTKLLNTLADNLSATKESFEWSSSSSYAHHASLCRFAVFANKSIVCGVDIFTRFVSLITWIKRPSNTEHILCAALDSDLVNVKCVLFWTFIPHIMWPSVYLVLAFMWNKRLLIFFLVRKRLLYANEILCLR